VDEGAVRPPETPLVTTPPSTRAPRPRAEAETTRSSERTSPPAARQPSSQASTSTPAPAPAPVVVTAAPAPATDASPAATPPVRLASEQTDPPPAVEAPLPSSARTPPVPTLQNRAQIGQLMARRSAIALIPDQVATRPHQVVIAVLVDPSGRVADSRVATTSGVPEIDRIALSVSRSMRFNVEPGTTTQSWVQMPLDFTP